MKAAVYQGGNEILLRVVDSPTPLEDEVLVKVEYCGICGSDLYICSGKNPRVHPPLIPGHEISGKIVEINSKKSSELKENDRVVVEPTISCGRCPACRRGLYHICQDLELIGVHLDGGYAQYVRAPVEKVHKLPEVVPFDAGALVEPLAVALHAVTRSKLRVGDLVAVLGAGPVGVLIAQTVRLMGATETIVVEKNPYRLGVAQDLGFKTIDAAEDDPSKEITRFTASGVDVLFEATGSPLASEKMVSLLSSRGEIVIVGLFKELAPLDLLNLMFKEAALTGSRVYTSQDFVKSIDLLAAGRIVTDPLICHRFPLEEVERGLEILRHEAKVMKVLLKPGEEGTNEGSG